jgi:hypothetical protein
MIKDLAISRLDDLFLIVNKDIAEKYDRYYCAIVSQLCFDSEIQRIFQDTGFDYLLSIECK